MAQRYELQQGDDERWSVIDRFTGQAVIEDGVTLTGLDLDDADDLVDLLNSRDAKRRASQE